MVIHCSLNHSGWVLFWVNIILIRVVEFRARLHLIWVSFCVPITRLSNKFWSIWWLMERLQRRFYLSVFHISALYNQFSLSCRLWWRLIILWWFLMPVFVATRSTWWPCTMLLHPILLTTSEPNNRRTLRNYSARDLFVLFSIQSWITGVFLQPLIKELRFAHLSVAYFEHF